MILDQIRRDARRDGPYEIVGSLVAYNTADAEIERVAASFASARIRSRMVVVDNSPQPASARICRTIGVDYYHTGANLGFGAAHNLAFEASKNAAKYHLVMNPDIEFDHATLPALLAFCEANPEVGLVMPKVIYPDGSPQHLCKRLPTPFDVFARRLFPVPLKILFRRQLDRYVLRDFDMERCLSVPYLSGCFMFLRNSALNRIGYFDPRFFMYFEDTDLTRRMRQLYDTVYYPFVTVTHEHGRGTYKSVRLFFCSIQSAVRYFNKWGWIQDKARRSTNQSCGLVGYGIGSPDDMLLECRDSRLQRS